MVLPDQPPAVGSLPDDIRVTRVTTLADFRLAQEIYWRCFNFTPDDPAQDGVEVDFDRFVGNPTAHRFLAWRGDQAVGAADAVLAAAGVVMFGGATLSHARGQGVYRALVWARWQEALRHGTPYLITQAGALSRPVLLRLGFVETAQIQNFMDSDF
jgi:GNAT superfamily N-acetyltransferase